MSLGTPTVPTFLVGDTYGPSGEQLTQGAALTQKIQDLAGAFSNGVPGLLTSSSVIGTGVALSNTTPFSQGTLEGSIYFPGTSSNCLTTGIAGCYLTSVNWSTVSGGFTLELWANFPSFANASTDATSFPVMIGNMNNPSMGGPAYYWGFGPTTSGTLYFSYYNGSSIQVSSGTTLSTNTWYHLCVQSNGTNIFQFVNGTLASTTAISGTVTVGTGNPFTLGVSYAKNPGPTMYIASARLTYGANLYSQGSFTAPTGPLGPAPTGQTVMLLRAPLYSAMTLKSPLNALSSVRVRCLPSDALIYLDAFGSNMPNKAPLTNSPTFDPYGTGAVLFRSAQSQYLDFGSQFFNVKSRGFTVVTKVQMVLTPSNYERIFQFYGPTNSSIYVLFIRAGTSTPFYGAFNNGSGEQALGYPTLASDVPYVIAMRYDPVINTWSLWINGINVVINSTSTNTPNDFISFQTQIGTSAANMNLYTFAAYNRALTDKEIQDATAALTQVAPVVPDTVEIGNVNGRPALTVDQTGAINVLGPLNGPPGAYAPVDLGINSLSLATGNLTSNISVTSFGPLGSSEGSLYFPGVANTYIQAGSTSQPFTNSNLYASDFLIEFWYYITPGGTGGRVVGYADTTSTVYWFVDMDANGVYFTGATQGNSGAQTSSPLPTGVWNHVAFINQSATRRLQVYFNGQPQTFRTSYGGFTTSGTVATYNTAIYTNATNGYVYIGQMGPAFPQPMSSSYVTNLRIVTGSGAAQIYNNNAFVPSTSPLFPASNTAGGSLTTRLLVRAPATKGQTGISKIGPGSGVLAFPPAPMTTYMTDLTGLSSYGQGKYVASASSEYNSGTLAWFSFQNSNPAQGWAAPGPNGAYPSTVNTVDVAGNIYNGEWIQLQMPSAIILSSYSVLWIAGYSTTRFCVLGSRDGVNWYLVHQYNGAALGSSTTSFSVTSSQAFSFYRMVVQTVTANITNIRQIVYNGSIESINVTADGRVGLGVVAPTRALEVAGDIVAGGTVSSGTGFMFRNKIINGDMRFNQRGGASGVAGTAGTSAVGYVGTDRWKVVPAITTGVIQQLQLQLVSSDLPFQYGFKYSTRWTASTALSNYQYVAIFQFVELSNWSDMAWMGSGQGSPCTLSFWFRAKATGQYCYAIRNTAASIQSWVGTFNVGAADTWGFYQFTIPPPGGSGATWNNASTTDGLQVQIGGVIKINTTSTPNSWSAPGSAPETATGYVDWPATLNNYVEFTGVQLEKGTVATPFEVRPYATELQLCQRYYQKSYDLGTNLGTATITGAITVSGQNTDQLGGFIFKVPMRTAPTSNIYSTSGTLGKASNSNGGLDTSGSVTGYLAGQNGITYWAGFGGGLTVGTGYRYQYFADAEL